MSRAKKNIISKKINFLFIFIWYLLRKFFKSSLVLLDQIYLNIYIDYFYFMLFFMKNNSICALNTLLDLAIIDSNYMYKYRFNLNYVFLNKIFNFRIILSIASDGFNSIISIASIFPSSNWLEREAWDMFGIKFLFHSNLRRILTDYSFKGHPLRKDFPIIGYTEIFYNDSVQGIQIIPVELTQNLRFYNFLNPWGRFKT